MTKQGKSSISRLYLRISTLFILILFVFAAITIYISVQAANKYGQEVTQNMNHDLRTPIASIQGYAETLILKKDNIEQEEQNRYLAVIFKNCENLQDLVTNLFELSKLHPTRLCSTKNHFPLVNLFTMWPISIESFPRKKV